MNLNLVTEECYFVLGKDKLGGSIRTEVWKHEDGIFHAYSEYIKYQDDNFIGYGESHDDKEAIILSKEALKEDWINQMNKWV